MIGIDTKQVSEIGAKLKARLAAEPRIEPAQVQKAPYSGPCTLGAACPVCGGSGWYALDVPTFDPRFGKLQKCPNVDVLRLPGAERYGIEPDEAQGLSWDSILPINDNSALQAASVVRQVLDQGYGWVYLYGDHGQAKTLILKIAIAQALKGNTQAAYANMSDVISHLQRAFDSEHANIESESRLGWWASLPVLALDEFDRFNKTRWAEASQFRLMDERNNQAIRGKSVTLIASNQSPDALDSYYRSRIYDGRFITLPLYGPDARPQMTWAQNY